MIGPAGLQGLRAILALQRGRAQQLWANRWPTAISTKPPCTQLTPSGAERARRERRHPKASTTKSLPPLTPLENNIRRYDTSLKRLKCANTCHSQG